MVNITKEHSKSHFSQIVHSVPDRDWQTRFQTRPTTRKTIRQNSFIFSTSSKRRQVATYHSADKENEQKPMELEV